MDEPPHVTAEEVDKGLKSSRRWLEMVTLAQRTVCHHFPVPSLCGVILASAMTRADVGRLLPMYRPVCRQGGNQPNQHLGPRHQGSRQEIQDNTVQEQRSPCREAERQQLNAHSAGQRAVRCNTTFTHLQHCTTHGANPDSSHSDVNRLRQVSPRMLDR